MMQPRSSEALIKANLKRIQSLKELVVKKEVYAKLPQTLIHLNLSELGLGLELRLASTIGITLETILRDARVGGITISKLAGRPYYFVGQEVLRMRQVVVRANLAREGLKSSQKQVVLREMLLF